MKREWRRHLGVLQGDCGIEIYENGKKVPEDMSCNTVEPSDDEEKRSV